MSVDDARAATLGIAPGTYGTRPVDQHRSNWCGACYLYAVVFMITDRWNIEIGRELTKTGERAQPFVELDAQAMLNDYDNLRSKTTDDETWNACKGGSPMHVLMLLQRGDMGIVQAHPRGYAWTGFPCKRGAPSTSKDLPSRVPVVFVNDGTSINTDVALRSGMRVQDSYVVPNNTEAVKRELMSRGSLVLGIDAECLIACDKFGFASTRPSGKRNHAVSVVGWVRARRGTWWVVRNSWGDHVPENMPSDTSCVSPGNNECDIARRPWNSIPQLPGFAYVSARYIERTCIDAKNNKASPWYACTLTHETEEREAPWLQD